MLNLLLTRTGLIAASIGLLLVVAGGWLRSEINAAEQRGQAVLLSEQSAREFAAILDSVNGSWAERDVAAKERIQRLASDLDDQKGIARVAREGAAQVVLAARGRIRTLYDSLATLTSDDLDVIAAGIDSIETAEQLCQGTLDTCQKLVQASDSRIFDVEAQARQSLELNRQQALTIDRLGSLRPARIGVVGWLGWAVAVGLGALVIVQ